MRIGHSQRDASDSHHVFQKPSCLKVAILFTAALLIVLVFIAATSNLREKWFCKNFSSPRSIFEGVTYGCDVIELSEEGSGVFHWARVDLTAPGIELYVTPLDSTAMSEGWQYRLRLVGEVVRHENLALAVNGTLFAAKPRLWLRMPGDFANGIEPIVASGVISHMWRDAYLLWFDDEMTPHLRPSKPIKPSELATAKWAIGGQDFWLRNGSVWSGSSREPDSRTAVGVDLLHRILFLAVGTHISPRLIFEKLAALGAKDGMLLDGGNSSSIAIGQGATDVPSGTVYGYWRPVANHFGVRARRLNAKILQ